jgi:hypothetical protein
MERDESPPEIRTSREESLMASEKRYVIRNSTSEKTYMGRRTGQVVRTYDVVDTKSGRCLYVYTSKSRATLYVRALNNGTVQPPEVA